MKKLVLVLFALLTIVSMSAKDVLSSKSSVRFREDIAKANKDLVKKLKKRTMWITKVTVEEWEDGQIYYVMKLRGGYFTIVRNGSEELFIKGQARNTDNGYFKSISLEKIDGHYLFKVNDKSYYSYDGKNNIYDAKLVTFGSKRYLYREYIGDYGSIKNEKRFSLMSLDGKLSLMGHTLQYVPKQDAGVYAIDDKGNGTFSLPAIEEHFVYTENHQELTTYVACMDGNIIKNVLLIPGGKLMVNNCNYSKPCGVRKKTDYDNNGTKFIREMSHAECLFKSPLNLQTTDGKTIFGGMKKIDFCMDDGVVYFVKYDSITYRDNWGAMVPQSPEQNVEPLFYSIRYIEGKPWVKTSAISLWEPYDKSKDYKKVEKNSLVADVESEDYNVIAIDCEYNNNCDIHSTFAYLIGSVELAKKALVEQDSICTIYRKGIDASKMISDDLTSYGKLSSGKKEYKFLQKAGKFYGILKKAGEIPVHLALQMEEYNGIRQFLQEELKENMDKTIPNARGTFLKIGIEKRQKEREEARRKREAREARIAKLQGFIDALNQAQSTMNTSRSYTKPKQNNNYNTVNTKAGGKSNKVFNSSTDNSNPTPKAVKCNLCHGKGTCNQCKGKGEYIPSVRVGHFVKCTHCDGTGKCNACHGKGTL